MSNTAPAGGGWGFFVVIIIIIINGVVGGRLKGTRWKRREDVDAAFQSERLFSSGLWSEQHSWSLMN